MKKRAIRALRCAHCRMWIMKSEVVAFDYPYRWLARAVAGVGLASSANSVVRVWRSPTSREARVPDNE